MQSEKLSNLLSPSCFPSRALPFDDVSSGCRLFFISHPAEYENFHKNSRGSREKMMKHYLMNINVRPKRDFFVILSTIFWSTPLALATNGKYEKLCNHTKCLRPHTLTFVHTFFSREIHSQRKKSWAHHLLMLFICFVYAHVAVIFCARWQHKKFATGWVREFVVGILPPSPHVDSYSEFELAISTAVRSVCDKTEWKFRSLCCGSALAKGSKLFIICQAWDSTRSCC